MLIKNYRIENRQYIYTPRFRPPEKEIIDRPLLDTSLGAGEKYIL
jgi:hypothetical protein